jgi:hypothetical protein
MATIVTPNVQEARLLLSHLQGTGPEEQEIKSVADMIAAARKLTQGSGVSATLVKGGHLIFKTQDVETGVEGVNIEWAQECDPEGVEVLKVAREAREGSKLWSPADQDLVVDVLYCARNLGSELEMKIKWSYLIRETSDPVDEHAWDRLHLERSHCLPPCARVPGMSGSNRPSKLLLTPSSRRGRSPSNHLYIYCRSPPLLATEEGMVHSIIHVPLPSTPYRSESISRVTTIVGLTTERRPNPYHPHPFLSAMVRRTKPLWDKFVRHPLVVELGKGILAQERFAHFCKCV